MISELQKHPLAYILLFGGLFISVVAYLGVWPNLFWQRLIAVWIGLYYAAWGISTHLKSKTITRHVIIEYGSVALLGTVILLLITF